MRKPILALTLLLTLFGSSITAHAGYLGLPNGRTADLTRLPDLSIEAGFVTGDFSDVDYQNLGLRLNYRLSPGLMLLADLGLVEIGSFDETAVGLGVYYAMGGLLEDYDTALKFSYNTADDFDVMALEMVVSGLNPISSSGLMWYGNLGLHRSDGGDSDTDLGFGAGVVLPLESGEAYLGVDMIGDLTFGIGYRYFYQ